jgi:regulator of protease activity HflC (stomatin/prohibitin superfamily)
MFRRVLVGDNERVIVIAKRRFREILGPGEHWLWTFGRSIALEYHNVRDIVFMSEWADYLAKERPDVVSRLFHVVETNDSQVAVIFLDNKVDRVIGPARRALFWRGPVSVAAELFDARNDIEPPARLVPALARIAREACVTLAVVEEGKRGLLYVDGRLVRELAAGTCAFWNAVVTPRVEVIETRLQTLEIAGQEILTKDKVTLRVNVSAVHEIADPVRARTSVRDAAAHLYWTVQIAVRQTLGKRTLEEVLAEKADIDTTVAAEVRREMATFGVRVGEIALKDIILPGDIRDILNQVVTAEKQAQANLIRRREETAATRSLLNTARLMEDNPLLVRMKELETLEKIADKVEKITVVGGLDGLLERTVTLRRE